MAWSYHDYETYDGATRIARLKSHIAEVSAEIGPDTSRAGVSRTNSGLVEYLKTLQARLTELGGMLDADSPRVRSGFTRARLI